MKDLGFKNKLLLTVTMVIIVCVGTSSILFYQQEKKALVDTIYAATKERIKFESQKIGEYLETKTRAVSDLADDYRHYNYTDNHIERLRVGSLALDVTNLMIGFDNGVAYASIDYPGWTDHTNPPNYDPRKRFWYQTGVKHIEREFITDLYHDAMTNILMVSIGKYAGNGRVILADIPLKVLSDVVANIDINGFSAAIVDSDNDVLASSSHVIKIGEKLTDYSALIDISKEIRKKDSTVIDYRLEGIDKVLFAEKIPYAEVDWHLLVGIDKSVVFSQLKKIKQQTIMFMITYLVFSVLIMLVVLNISYRPIQALKDTILGLSEGSGYITQRLKITSSDDLGQIALGVNKFIDKIQELLLHENVTSTPLTKGEFELKKLNDNVTQRWEDVFAQYKYRVNKEEQLREELKIDEMTKLPTRSYFEVLLAEAIKDIYTEKGKLLLFSINIGNYETISESYTYEQLYRAIVELTEKIEAMLTQGVVLSRTGHAEFSIILKHHESDSSFDNLVQQLASQLRDIETSVMTFHCKIGATHFDYRDDKPSVSGLFYRVSNALYSVADYADKNYAFYHKEQDIEKEKKQALIADFKAALKKDHELELYFQPQVNIITHHVCGAEALIRWNHPTQGFLTPDKFVDVLDDDLSLNTQFGEWLIISALEKLTARSDDLTISVNITPFHLQKENFFTRLKQILSAYPASTSKRLKIELTETAGISDHARVQTSMHKCSELGVRFSLDDFGTGYSTLSQLRTLPASELKIDRSFVRTIEKSAEDRKMVNTMMLLAKSFDIGVVVEGVENNEQEKLLKELGCIIVQGYCYSRPVPYQKFNQWLDHYNSQRINASIH